MVEIGFVGLGNLGGAMARRIAEEGYPLRVWARRAVSLEEVAGTAATTAPDLAALGRDSEIVGLCVMNDDDVSQVSREILEGMRPGGIIMIHSTVLPETCIRVAAQAAEKGVKVIDAPATGGRSGVQARMVAVPCGGEPEDFERCRPVLETFGNPVRLFGPLGSGQIVKLLKNFTFIARLDILLRAVETAEEMGFPRAAVAEVLTHDLSRTRSRMTPVAVGGHLPPESIAKTCSTLGKDLHHAVAVYHERGLDAEPLEGLAADALARLAREADAALA